MSTSLLEASDSWQRAIEARDTKAAGEFLHAEYALVHIHPAPATMPREQWLATLQDYILHEYEVLARTIDEKEGLAVVMQRVRMEATVRGQDRSGTFVLSDIWLKDLNNRWRVWRRHSTPLAAGEFPSAPEG